MNQHGVEANDQLVHAGSQGNLGRFAAGYQTSVEIGQNPGGVGRRRYRCHLQNMPHVRPTTRNMAVPVALAAVVIEGGDPDQSGDLATGQVPQLG